MFKPIPNFPNYQINEYGEVKSVFVSKLLRPRKSGRGYYSYQLRNENGTTNMYIHRLVAITFIPNPLNLPQVDHINGDKSNNHVSNLRWVDRSTNMLSYGYTTRCKNSAAAVNIHIIAVNNNQIHEFSSQSDLLRYFGYNSATSHLKFNIPYLYGKLKGYTLYRIDGAPLT